MANQRNLKAFVRYDGSGRVVAGSLVLRKKKPKVGRWEEILTYECCNDVPSTTTSTTTQVQSYVHQALWSDVNKAGACSGTFITVYSSVPNLGNNVNIYLDQALTQTVNYNYISVGNDVYNCMSGFLYGQELCSALTTTTTTTSI
jgi:ribosomal protein S26